MGLIQRADRVTFSGGELGTDLNARADLARYQTSLEAIENFIVLKGGGMTRTPGTRFVLEHKDQSQRSKFIPFRRSATDYLMLAVNGGAARFLKGSGFVQNPDTTPYELTVPWTESSLLTLRASQEGDTLYVVSSLKPQEIKRAGTLSWTCADYASDSGPVDTQNVVQATTVQASAVTGNINLTGVGNPLTAAMVGGVMRLDDRDLSTTPEWRATETAIAVNAERRWNGNVYRASVNGVDAGPNAPIHTEGSVSAGSGLQTWEYLHSGYGYVRILTAPSGNAGTATVLKRLPANVVSGATYRWSPPAWSSDLGYPNAIAYRYPRLGFFRGNTGWLTGEDDAHNHDLGRAEDADAIAFRIIPPDASLVDILWALPSGVLVLGTSDLEWTLRGASPFDPLTPKTARPFPLGTDGSIPQIAVLVDGGVMFIGKSGKRLHYTKHDNQKQELGSSEISVGAEHIFIPGCIGVCWQRDPQRVAWLWFADGTFATLTFMPEQQVIAFCRQPRSNMFVEDIAVIPGVAGGRDEVYFSVRRTINGQTRRYYEQLADYFVPANRDAPTAEGAWFLDCALRITGTGLTSVTQLAHLEGQEVGVWADGAMQASKTVVSGTIALDRPSSDVLVGLPIRAYARDLPRNFGGTTGKQKSVKDALIHTLYTAGLKARQYDPEYPGDEWEEFSPTGAQKYGGWPALFSGRKELVVSGDARDEAQLEILVDNHGPCTILAMSPSIDVEEDG